MCVGGGLGPATEGRNGEGSCIAVIDVSFLCFSTQSKPSSLTSTVLDAGAPAWLWGKRCDGFPFILYLVFKCVTPFVLLFGL